MRVTGEWRRTLQVGLVWAATACGGADKAGRSDTTDMSSAPPAGEAVPPADTGPAAVGDTAKPADTTAGVAATKPAATPKPPAQKSAAPKPAAPKPAAGGARSPQQVALGDSIFHGQVAGGTCTACHGQDAKGTAVGPDLTDSEWLNGDGSYDFLVKVITNGVPQPKKHPAPMPPKGGASITDEQVKAAAAYVYSLSHKS